MTSNNIKRTESITYDYSGGPIPEVVKKSYVKQQLPVRKQSLAVYGKAARKKKGRPSILTPLNGWGADEDEFDFKNRPPSAITCTEPIDPSQIIDEDIPTYLNTNFSEEMLIDDVDADDHYREWRKASLSSDTATIIQPEDPENNSVMFIMQRKIREQQKSIDAYYNKSIHNALLSEVATEFYRRVNLVSLFKEGVEYHDVFTGKEAVNCLLSVLCILNRKEALGVGSALYNQNFFHNINNEKDLLDSDDEVYVFFKKDNEIITEDDLPTGVYTPFSACYSYMCKDKNSCYSYSCPNRKNPDDVKDNLWINSVPTSILEKISPQEIKRQECIFELIYTERDFVRDLQYINTSWVDKLLLEKIIPEENRERFVELVFSNIAEIEAVNSELLKALDYKQSQAPVVSELGEILVKHVSNFEPFVRYGANQLVGKFYFELEKKRNPVFAKFVKETERHESSRRLELNGYLTKPTTRLGRYNLLLKEILKKTPEDNPDQVFIPKVMKIITEYLVQLNTETGKTENEFNLEQVHTRLSFKSPAESADLKLQDPERQLILKSRMKRKGNLSSEAADIQVFLFDNYLVISKIKIIDHLEHYRAIRKPIPLELLSIQTSSSNRQKRTSSLLPYSKSPNSSNPAPSNSESFQSKSNNQSITFNHHGRRGSPPITLYPTSGSNQQLWIKSIKKLQEKFADERQVFSIIPLIKSHFPITNKVNSTITLDAEQKRFLIGTDQGVYVTHKDSEQNKLAVTRIIHLDKVSKVELMPDSQILVLSDKTLWSFPLDILSPNLLQQQKRGKSISQNVAFFHVGECMSKTLVCVVKTTALSTTTIRIFEPVVMNEIKKAKSVFNIKIFGRSGPVALKPYKDLYLPSEASSISLLASKMCISLAKEIDVIDMKSFCVQTLLNPANKNLFFVSSRTDIKPMAIYRIKTNTFLVCYNEFTFIVDQKGDLDKQSITINWEGLPETFAFSYPYILAFEPDFIEGELEQIIRGRNIKCTSNVSQSFNIQFTMTDPDDDSHQIVYQLELENETDILYSLTQEQ